MSCNFPLLDINTDVISFWYDMRNQTTNPVLPSFQLWDIMGDMSRPLMDTVKHFLARAVCLIALPISLYIFYFWIHLTVLYKRCVRV